MSVITVTVSVVALLAVYMTAVAWFAIFSDETLSGFQRIAQSLLAFVVPVLGPVAVLHFASPLPDNIRQLVPWPFRSMVAGKPLRKGVGNEEFIDNEDHFNP